MALDIANPAVFDALVAFAAREGKEKDLGAKLHWLDTFGRRTKTKCVLSAAPSPWTFDLVMFGRDGKVWRPMFIGRLVYQMPDTRDGHWGAWTFAVSITATRDNSTLSQTVST